MLILQLLFFSNFISVTVYYVLKQFY